MTIIDFQWALPKAFPIQPIIIKAGPRPFLGSANQTSLYQIQVHVIQPQPLSAAARQFSVFTEVEAQEIPNSRGALL
jgi:hypothetical protein